MTLKNPAFHCAACGISIQPTRKIPVTTFWAMVSSEDSKEYMKNFPSDEEEDLCSTCRGTIRDLNSDFTNPELFNFDNSSLVENEEDTDDPTYVDEVYQGYRD